MLLIGVCLALDEIAIGMPLIAFAMVAALLVALAVDDRDIFHKKQAIAAGVAYYAVDAETGKTTFRYIDIKKVEECK